MTCPKCAGLMVDETADSLSYRRCLNCGKREGYVMEERMERDASKAECEKMQAMEHIVYPSCSVPGCKKPQYTEKGTVQCKRHYTKALRNNTKHRARAKQAMNGTAEGATWKSPVLETLFSQRELVAAKLQDIDRAITAIKGL